MRLARWLFGIAAAYGLIATLSLYFREPLIGASLWLFAFAGAAVATQLLYVALAIDPARYWRLIPIGVVSKLSFGVPVIVLSARGAHDRGLIAAGLVDLVLAAAFAAAFLRLRRG